MIGIKKYTLIVIFFLLSLFHAEGQIGFGITYGIDLYQYHRNPTMQPDTLQHGIGSALFNLNLGPKLWIGGKNLSISLEAQIGVAPFALDLDEYKGMGAFYFPMLATINYGGLSGFQEKGKWGVGIAGGFQYTRTDLYFLKTEFEDIERDLFQTVFAQLNVGLGSKATAIYAYVRFAQGDLDAANWHIGIMLDQNFIHRKKLALRTKETKN